MTLNIIDLRRLVSYFFDLLNKNKSIFCFAGTHISCPFIVFTLHVIRFLKLFENKFFLYFK